MARSPHVLLLPLLLATSGCSGAFWGNLLVLGVTFGIFFGTLSLGRSGVSTIRSSSAEHSGRS